MEKIHELRSAVRQLPEKKRYAEFITAVLSVPVLITVLIMNVNNLKKSEAPSGQVMSALTTPTQTPHPSPSAKTTPTQKNSGKLTSPTTPTPLDEISRTGCMKLIGPLEISSPKEDEILTKNSLSIDITRTGTNYCEIVWSYRLNSDGWSEYMDKSLVLYNLTPGKNILELKVKSIASSDQQTFTRSFTVPGNTTPVASSSAQLQ